MKCPASKRKLSNISKEVNEDRSSALSCDLAHHAGTIASDDFKLKAHPHFDWIQQNMQGEWHFFPYSSTRRLDWLYGDRKGREPSTYGIRFELEDDFLLYRTKFL